MSEVRDIARLLPSGLVVGGVTDGPDEVIIAAHALGTGPHVQSAGASPGGSMAGTSDVSGLSRPMVAMFGCACRCGGSAARIRNGPAPAPSRE